MFNTLNHTKMKKRVLLFACLGTTICPHAQTTMQADSLQKLQDSLKQVTVTATRTDKDVMNVGRDVTIITSEQIKNSASNTMAELLSLQAGIYIVGTGQNPGSVQNMFMRGADDNHTTVMIDGVPVSDPSTDNGAIELSELSLADVERIEIVRGSHSTLYGSSSIGGVVNIITKKNDTPGFHITASETGGEFGAKTSSFDENMLLNYTTNSGFYFDAGFHRLDVMGLNSTVDTVTVPLPFDANPDRDNFIKQDMFYKAGFRNTRCNAYIEYKNTNQTSGLDAAAFTDATNYTGQTTRNFFNGIFNYSISDNFHIQYIGSYSPVQRKYLEDTNVIDAYNDKYYQSQLYNSSVMTHDVQATYTIKTSHFIIGGGTYTESMNYTSLSIYDGFPTRDSVNNVKQSINNVYAQADINGGTFTSGLAPFSMLMGARYSANSMFGNNISYELNPYYKASDNTVLYLSYSTGFNAPGLYQLYAPEKGGSNPSTSVTRGNANLTPETSSSFEVGIKYRIPNAYFTICWFNTIVKNHIDYVYMWNKGKPIDSLNGSDYLGDTYLNIGQENTQGFELNATVKLTEKLNLSANFSLLSSSLSYTPADINMTQTNGNYVQVFDGGGFLNQNQKSQSLIRRPGDMANISIAYSPVKKCMLTLRVRYVGNRTDGQYDYTLGPYGADVAKEMGSYTLLDAFAAYDICKNLSASLRVENIFNTTYYEILGYTTLGRSIYLNLRYNL
jgi:vitamin B12 transporter